MIGWLLYGVVLVSVLLALAWTVYRALQDPDLLHRAARAEIDLYRVRRSIETSQLKHEIRRTGRQLERELRDELK